MTGKTNYDLSTFSKEGEIEDVKIGTKIWFIDEYETDVGIVIVDEELRLGLGGTLVLVKLSVKKVLTAIGELLWKIHEIKRSKIKTDTNTMM